jgi:hypothetical protein
MRRASLRNISVPATLSMPLSRSTRSSEAVGERQIQCVHGAYTKFLAASVGLPSNRAVVFGRITRSNGPRHQRDPAETRCGLQGCPYQRACPVALDHAAVGDREVSLGREVAASHHLLPSAAHGNVIPASGSFCGVARLRNSFGRCPWIIVLLFRRNSPMTVVSSSR